MHIYPLELERLLDFFKKLPGIGEKSAERLALSLLELPDEYLQMVSSDIVNAKKNLHPCSICGQITNNKVCDICDSSTRNHNLICVIEDYKSVFAFEKAGNYNGVYHVLNGLLSPMEDIGVDDINIASLVRRVDKLENPEIILALKSSIEGETTTLYIQKIFENKKVKISRLSYGLPLGAEIDYLDTTTLDKALEDRKIISE